MIFTKIERDRYIDSLETLSETAILNEQPGIETGYVGMATQVFKEVIEEIGLSTPEIAACTEADRDRLGRERAHRRRGEA